MRTSIPRFVWPATRFGRHRDEDRLAAETPERSADADSRKRFCNQEAAAAMGVEPRGAASDDARGAAGPVSVACSRQGERAPPELHGVPIMKLVQPVSAVFGGIPLQRNFTRRPPPSHQPGLAASQRAPRGRGRDDAFGPGLSPSCAAGESTLGPGERVLGGL